MNTDVEEMLSDIRTYNEFIQPYETALSVILVQLEGIQKDLERSLGHKAIHSFRHRIKKPASILEKMERKNLEPSFEMAKECLTDIAGIRIMCYYIKDVYKIAEILKKQLDVIMVKQSDYIENPKPNWISKPSSDSRSAGLRGEHERILSGGTTDPYSGHGLLGQYGTSALL